MFKKIFAFAFLLAFVVSIPGVIDLTDDNFDKLVTADQGLWLVFFSADWVLFICYVVWSLSTSQTRN